MKRLTRFSLMLCIAFLGVSLWGQGQHVPVQINTSVPSLKRKLKTFVSEGRKVRYEDILRRSQETWNTGDDHAYAAFWRSLSRDKQQLVRAHARTFHQGTAYLRFISQLSRQGKSLQRPKPKRRPREQQRHYRPPAFDPTSASTRSATPEEIQRYHQRLDNAKDICEAYKDIPTEFRNSVLKDIAKKDRPLFRRIKIKCHG